MKHLKSAALLLAACLVLSSCGSTVSDSSTGKETATTSSSTVEVTQSSTESTSSDESSVSTETSSTASEETQTTKTVEIPEIADNSKDFAKNLKLGWNMGNTLDATAGSGMDTETSWGQPKVTKELIEYVKEVGFTSIRIPVSWSKHIDMDYNIDEEWMDRVNEIVDWALDAGLFVIVNSHHDNSFYYPTEEKLANGERYMERIWSQIAERFKDYDEHLIFEAMNEPRLEGTSKEWWFMQDDPEGIESIEVIGKLDQKFVDVVRAAGGYNETRYLLVCSNAANPENSLNDAFTVPTDPANHILISIHAYTPYDFAMNKNGYDNWVSSEHENEFEFMSKLNMKFILKGYGVVITEFGATSKSNDADRITWAKDYTRTAKKYGISCFIWDNGAHGSGEEQFGMIDRDNLTLYYPDLFDAYHLFYK